MGPNRRIVYLIIADILSAEIALSLAMFMKSGSFPHLSDVRNLGWDKFAGFVVIVVFISFLAESYRNHRQLQASDIAIKIGFSLGGSSIIFAILSWIIAPDAQSGILVTAVLLFGSFQFLCHISYRLIVKFRGFAKRVLILGVGKFAGNMGALLPSSDDNYVLSGYVNCSNEAAAVPDWNIVDNHEGLYETVKREKADKIVVSLSERRGVFPYQDVMACKLDGVEVVDAPSFYEQMTGKLFLEGINPSWIIFSEGFKVSAWKKMAKRGLDLVCAFIGIILTLPFLPLVALIIRLDSPGPVFYRQKRVGEKERCFNLYKLRTMRQDAEAGTGAVWAQKNDVRVTRVGEFLRKSRIDELPQFFNILRGDMSMVGPRPERPEFVDELKKIVPYYSERHFVKPGVTGWAQVRFEYGASVEDSMEKLRYDLYYIKNLSFSFDIMIILETIKVVLFRKGAR